MLEDKIAREIVQSIPFFQSLLREGCALVEDITQSGLDVEVKGRYKTGVTDYVTRADKELGALYSVRVQQEFPHWACILEDGIEVMDATELASKELIVFFDPVDGTRLLAQGRPGSSTMMSIAYREENSFIPAAGAMKLFSGEEMYGFAVGEHKKCSDFVTSPRRAQELVIGRSDTDRQGFLIPLCQELSYEQVMLRGVAPKMSAMLRGEIDLFVFEPGITYWDIFPVMGILHACGGKAVDWKREEIVYTGLSTSVKHGFLALAPGVNYYAVIENVSGIYERLLK